ncbi:uncharacterized protein CTRU02_208654 [Colletotrichum truncatum]|uniref:Uncharacterized protein n=1 Tax=Colletotrichum truncatum TaxID=5467 RepID=A0ACC3YWY6_COLTU|nr:uncharacterized protein CTRU02_06688 [Colletotrichum truncatum]KAF6792605.1 hypothetical protein CTRU02_06688 [Colletotrichum truncatum]
MQPIAYLGVLLLFSTSAVAAPSRHIHLQRHRHRAATHAHSRHDHSLLEKRAEQIRMEAEKIALPIPQDLPMDAPQRQPSSKDDTVITLWGHHHEGDSAVVGHNEPVIRMTETVTGRGKLGDDRIDITTVHDNNRKKVTDGFDSRHLDGALSLLRSHSAGKHNGYRH